jgi:hypothetical protein
MKIVRDHRAAGESADPAVTGSGMECGHAAPQVQEARAPSGQPLPGEPARAAVFEPCRRRIEPDFTQNCPNEATGGYRLTLHAAPAVQKRWGKRSMLTLIVDLPVCPECFARSTVFDMTDVKLRAALNVEAQRHNKGILVDWKETELEHVAFSDPEYQILLSHTTGRRAIDSQPAPAGPQPEGAGDGKQGSGEVG